MELEMSQNAPIILAYVGVILAIALSGGGSAYGVTLTAKAAIGGMKKTPESFGTFLILCTPPSTNGLYGFLGYFMMSGHLAAGTDLSMYKAAAIFAACTALGIVNLCSAVFQGQASASAIAAISSGHDIFGKSLMVIVFAELYAIVALAALFLINQSLL